MSLANDTFDNITSSNSNQRIINKNVIKENYFPEIKSFDAFSANPQGIAENIENISNKYNIYVNNISENISEKSNDDIDEDIIIQSPYEEKILLIKFSGKITIKDILDFYKSGITSYHQVSRNTIIAKVRAENIEKLKNFPFIGKIREYKPADKINPDDKTKMDQMIQSEKRDSRLTIRWLITA